MQKLIVDNNDQISSLIEDKLVPVLEDLKKIKQDSGTELIENAVDRLRKWINENRINTNEIDKKLKDRIK